MPAERLYDPAQDKNWSSEVYHKAKQVIEETLSTTKKALEFSTICQAVKQKYPSLCDDSIKDRKYPKLAYWRHLVATAISALQKAGKVAKSTDGWIWVEGKSPQPTPQVAPQSAPPSAAPPKRHDELKQKMIDIGKRLGYHTTTEESLGQYRPDVLWKRGPQRRDPCHVIEICAGGSLAKDFDSLNWAREDLEAKGILVTVDEPDYHRAVQRFGNQAQIVVAKAETVDRLHELITTNLEFLRVIFREHS